jgi:hypothetical protein
MDLSLRLWLIDLSHQGHQGCSMSRDYDESAMRLASAGYASGENRRGALLGVRPSMARRAPTRHALVCVSREEQGAYMPGRGAGASSARHCPTLDAHES